MASSAFSRLALAIWLRMTSLSVWVWKRQPSAIMAVLISSALVRFPLWAKPTKPPGE